MIYGRDSFKKHRGCIAYYIEMDIADSACGIETGAWYGKTVLAAPCSGYENCTDDGRRFGSQTMNERSLCMKRVKMTAEERKKHRYEMSEAYRKKVLRFTLQFNPTTDMEARKWFEENNKSGAYLKRLILEDKARRLGEKGGDIKEQH